MKKLLSPLLIALFAVSFAGCAGMAQKGALSGAHSAIKKSKYDDAIVKLSQAESYKIPTPELQAEMSYLRGYCYEMLKRTPEAIGCYRYVVDAFPSSSYAYQARERLAILSAKTE